MVVGVGGRNDAPSSRSKSARAPAPVGPQGVLDADPLPGTNNVRNAVSGKYLMGLSWPTASCAVRGRAMDVSTPAQTFGYPRFSGLTYSGSNFRTSHQHNVYIHTLSLPSASSIDICTNDHHYFRCLGKHTVNSIQRTRTPLIDLHACITCPSLAACCLDETSRRIAPRGSVSISRPQTKHCKSPQQDALPAPLSTMIRSTQIARLNDGN